MSRILPILFNTEMVRGILDGRKTTTRRVIKPANPFRSRGEFFQGNGLWIDGYSKSDKPNGSVKDYSISSCWMDKKLYIDRYAPYRMGDILYVRETWGWEPCWDCGMDTEDGGCVYGKVYNQKKREYGCYCYKASMDDGEELSVDTWHPSIHMPKAAARIWLEVTDIRIERLQDIDDNGILAEGLEIGCYFEDLWDSTIKKSDLAKYGWDANPWVYVIEFERCEKPESEVVE